MKIPYVTKRYGISQSQWDAILKKQNFRCAVCFRHKSEDITLCVDHDHRTKEVRGLLCRNCNHRVVGRHTNPILLRNAADYLETARTGLFVPRKNRRKRRDELI